MSASPPKRAVGIDLNDIFAVGALFDQLGKLFRSDLEGVLLVNGGAELKGRLGAGADSCDGADHHDGQHHGKEFGQFFHVVSPFTEILLFSKPVRQLKRDNGAGNSLKNRR